jgi:hypothetical protein
MKNDQVSRVGEEVVITEEEAAFLRGFKGFLLSKGGGALLLSDKVTGNKSATGLSKLG